MISSPLLISLMHIYAILTCGRLTSNVHFSLSYILHPITWVLGMTSPIQPRDLEDVEFPPDSQDVTTWRNNLGGLYRGSSSSRKGMGKLTVTEVRHFKRKAHPQHEFVVASVKDGSQIRLVQIEHTKQSNASTLQQSGDVLKTPPESAARLNTSAKIVNIVSSSLDSLTLISRDAHNRVRTVHGWPKDSECFQTVTFCRCAGPPWLFDLALVSSIVHESSPLYRLFKSQCYWFADVTVHVLRKMYEKSD